MEIDGAPWFVAQDAAAALGLYTAGGAGGYTRHLAADEKMVVKRSNMDRMHDWPTRGFVCVSEAGLYKLVMRSDRPEAKRFRDWVARDVLPAPQADLTCWYPLDRSEAQDHERSDYPFRR
nr:Bro-N domain-containing protein [Azospirillum brasilense]